MDNTSDIPKVMPPHLLEEITDNFSKDQKVGAGSHGSVYKICLCISAYSEMMNSPLLKSISYPLHVTNNKGRLHEITISKIFYPEDEASTLEEPINPKIKIMDCTEDFRPVWKIDVHPTETWILIGYIGGHVSIWNHQTQATVMEFENTGDQDITCITSVRFIARKEWCVAGDDTGNMHVYSYITRQKLKKFQAHEDWVTSLAVHPTDPFLLSSSTDKLIKLWNWDDGWKCIRTFQGHSRRVNSVKFNPLTASNTFASASGDGTIQIWSIFSDTPITSLECGTSESLLSVDYFAAQGNQDYIVAGLRNGTADIWDLETKTCIKKLTALQQMYSNVAVFDCLLGHPIIVTISNRGVVSFCNSCMHRYQNMVDFELGKVLDIAYCKGTRSLIIAAQRGIGIMEMS